MKAKTPTPDQIRKAREAKGHSQGEAAAAIGYGRVAWCRWENGNRRMRPALFKAYQAVR